MSGCSHGRVAVPGVSRGTAGGDRAESASGGGRAGAAPLPLQAAAATRGYSSAPSSGSKTSPVTPARGWDGSGRGECGWMGRWLDRKVAGQKGGWTGGWLAGSTSQELSSITPTSLRGTDTPRKYGCLGASADGADSLREGSRFRGRLATRVILG